MQLFYKVTVEGGECYMYVKITLKILNYPEIQRLHIYNIIDQQLLSFCSDIRI